MGSLLSFLVLIFMAFTAHGTPTPRNAALNGTIQARFQADEPYYDLDLNMPICVPNTGSNLCTMTIVGHNDLAYAYVYFFDYQCNNWQFDPEGDWGALSQNQFQIISPYLDALAFVHADKDLFMQGQFDDNFKIGMNEWWHNWNDASLWGEGLSSGLRQGGYVLKRMVWICKQ